MDARGSPRASLAPVCAASGGCPAASLIKIQNVNQKSDTDFYMGKRVAYIYKAKKEINNSKFRVIWGKVSRPHGNNGVVRARFRTNLPPCAIAAPCRIMLYPSRV